jgi:hypothetical protein
VKTKSAVLSAATLLAAIILNPTDATAESLATGCLAKLSGEIYALKAYGSAPAKKCRSGDQIIRVQLHQPTTKFAKRSFSLSDVNPDGLGDIFAMSEDFRLFLSEDEEGNCIFSAVGLESDYRQVIAIVPPNRFQHGVNEVTEVDFQSDDDDAETHQSNGLVVPSSDGWLMFHDLYISNEGECSVSFVLEYDGEFYDK